MISKFYLDKKNKLCHNQITLNFHFKSYTHNVSERIIMFQLTQLWRVFRYLCMLAVTLLCVLCSSGLKVQAKTVTYYSYQSVYNALPSKFQKEDYIYESDGIPCIAFATYNGDQNYGTSLKKTTGGNDFLYCVDYSKHIIFNKNFSAKNKLFNNELRTRLGIAFYYGTTKWGEKANSRFTTGNHILDYYMTQVVVHSLIYKYGGSKSNYGIQYSLIDFKENTGVLKDKTDELYKFCCNQKITLGGGKFQSADFSFVTPNTRALTIDADYLTSPLIQCKTDISSGSINSFKREIISKDIKKEHILLENENSKYNSAFKVRIPVYFAEQLEPGSHMISVSEQINFDTMIAGFWNCSDSGLTDVNQEVGGLISNDNDLSVNMDFELLVGEVSLHKKDSITGETITDAVFQLLQYDVIAGEYQFYKNLTYNTVTGCYESGNIYLQGNNPEGKFKLIEAESGANYLNDWAGEEFVITRDNYCYEFVVENQPILGRLELHKDGENISFLENTFRTEQMIPLEGITFSLFADDDIYIKGQLLYRKDQKIVDLITDSKGNASVMDLPEGNYYLKESNTQDIYFLSPEAFCFSITRDDNRKYSEVSYQAVNHLKNCQIQLFKYYYKKSDKEQNNKIPLQGAKFGLYAKNDILDAAGNCILKKDSLIEEKYSDKEGLITFNNLPYADYYVKELEAPKDFILNSESISISKEELLPVKTVETTDQVYNAYREIINYKKLYKIKLTKYGENFFDVQKNLSENGEYFSYQLSKVPLENVTFSLYDDEDNLVAANVTDLEGNLYFSDIEAGEYYYVEDSCLENYLKLSERRQIICDSDNALIEDTVMNELCKINLSICKSGEQVRITKKGISYETQPLEGVVFGIYQGFDYKMNSGNSLLKDSCVGYLVTDRQGTAVYEGKLPTGSYYLKELKTTPGYEIDKREYPFDVSPEQNQNQTIRLENDNIFMNMLLKSSVQINKTDANTNKSLKNVEFTLYNDRDQIIGVYKTDKKGKILVEDLPYGTYYFIETKCKNGYYSTNNKYKFTLQSQEKVTLNITNAPILKLGFEEHFKRGMIMIFVLILASGIFAISVCRRKRIKEDFYDN